MASKTWNGSVSGDWSVSGNWTPSGAPSSGDDITFIDNAVSVSAGLDNHTVTYGSITFYKSYTGQIGLFAITGNTYLSVAAVTNGITIGVDNGIGQPAGSTLIAIDVRTSATTLNILASSNTGPDVYSPPIQLIGAHLVLNMFSGNVGIGLGVGETPTIDSLNISAGGIARVTIGSGATLTAAILNGGTVVNRSTNTSPSVILGGSGASYVNLGSGAHSAITINSGKVVYSGTGTATVINCSGSLDFSQDTRAKTVTTINAYAGHDINLGGVKNMVTLTNGIILTNCSGDDGVRHIPPNQTIKLS